MSRAIICTCRRPRDFEWQQSRNVEACQSWRDMALRLAARGSLHSSALYRDTRSAPYFDRPREALPYLDMLHERGRKDGFAIVPAVFGAREIALTLRRLTAATLRRSRAGIRY